MYNHDFHTGFGPGRRRCRHLCWAGVRCCLGLLLRSTIFADHLTTLVRLSLRLHRSMLQTGSHCAAFSLQRGYSFDGFLHQFRAWRVSRGQHPFLLPALDCCTFDQRVAWPGGKSHEYSKLADCHLCSVLVH